ncbi:TD and POZ domain-containing protein 4-like [Diachasma alloeum]|uniref:TD and POZ domain-containing protein 4-like n=1 Tax=Diachasma alloeum TaxID=454923 RepID=UPI00073829A1|nr:TD and POZ domain-containing protein 4-like [Diachasma alloeum]
MSTHSNIIGNNTFMMSGSQNVMTYTCESWTSDFQARFMMCGEFPSGVVDNCTISVWLRHTSKSTSRVGSAVRVHRDVEVLVKKTIHRPVRAHMSLRIRQTQSWVAEQTKLLEVWRESCFFSDFCFTSFFNDTKYRIVLQITWNLADMEDPSNRPNPYLEVSDFLMTRSLSDVKIIIGDERILAHKLILSAASPVFHAMLTSPMKEGMENCVVIEDIDAGIMKTVLKILYTGRDEDLDRLEIAWEVLAVAEKYDMKVLKDQCEQKLLNNLTVNNVLQILDDADTYQAETLKKECMKFIIRHQKEIIATDYFEEIFIRKPLLMMQFTVGIVNSKSNLFK